MKTKSQEKIIRFVKDSIGSEECCTVVAQPGAVGLLYVYNEIIKELKDQVKSILVDNHVKAESLLVEIARSENNKPIIIGLFSENYQDYSFLIEKLESLQLNNILSCPVIVITTIPTVYSAIKQKSKLINKSLFVPGLLAEEELEKYIDTIAEKLQTVIGFTERERIIYLSGGHIGLIKNLIKVKKRGYNLHANIEEIMVQPEIMLWMKEITIGIEDSVLEKMIRPVGLSFDQSDFLSTFKYIVNSTPYSPLVEAYLKLRFPEGSIHKDIPKNLRINLSSQEIKVVSLLWSKTEAIVSKEEIASAMWGDKSKEKFSEWAITQLMTRLRRKLKNIAPYISILSRKGEGYELINDML
jgi:hypothetical protein